MYSEAAENDKIRTDYLKSMGVDVMRFPNRDIWQDFERVCKQIDYTDNKRIGEQDLTHR